MYEPASGNNGSNHNGSRITKAYDLVFNSPEICELVRDAESLLGPLSTHQLNTKNLAVIVTHDWLGRNHLNGNFPDLLDHVYQSLNETIESYRYYQQTKRNGHGQASSYHP